MLSALLLLAYNEWETRSAEEESRVMLKEIRAQMPAQTPPAAVNSTPQPTAAPELTSQPVEEETPMPVETDVPAPTQSVSYEYIGILSIPYLELELPVMAEWDYKRLKIAPCRQYGDAKSDDLVIAAHNYRSHFGELSDLPDGMQIVLTETDGTVNNYVLQRIETVDPEAVEAVLNSGNDLVLYTCTPGGKMRVAAFCDREE